jgi:hypothetical protein
MTQGEKRELRQLDSMFTICDCLMLRALAEPNIEQAEAYFHKAFGYYQLIRHQFTEITGDKI